jgi:hypothetical protein
MVFHLEAFHLREHHRHKLMSAAVMAQLHETQRLQQCRPNDTKSVTTLQWEILVDARKKYSLFRLIESAFTDTR